MKLKQILEQHFSSEPTLLDSLLNARENQKVLEVHENLKVLDSVTLALQRESIDLSSTRLLFDEVVNCVPELDMDMKYLAPNASFIASPNFENGVVKILDENEANLTIREKEECQSLRSCTAVLPSVGASSSDFATRVLESKRAKTTATEYMSCKFLEPTSNHIERFFSGYSLGDLRQSITPLHLQEQLFLKANARMWNIETVNDAPQEEN